MKNISAELEALGIKHEISQETAEAQWAKLAKEYRLVGERGDAYAVNKRDFIIAIMCGDVQFEDSAAGVAIRQFVQHPQGGGPKEIVYNPPNAKTIAAGGVDAVSLATKWCRIAAALSNNNEGQLTLWLTGRDASLMEDIAQFFTSL